MDRREARAWGWWFGSAATNRARRVTDHFVVVSLSLGPLDALRSRAYCVASNCKHESGNHHRILHGLKLRTEGRQFGGKNPCPETANRFLETHALGRRRL